MPAARQIGEQLAERAARHSLPLKHLKLPGLADSGMDEMVLPLHLRPESFAGLALASALNFDCTHALAQVSIWSGVRAEASVRALFKALAMSPDSFAM